MVSEINKYIDHTLLRPEASPDDISALCFEAAEYGFCAVCVNPCYVRQAAAELRSCGVKVASVVGFPLGASVTSVKAFEAARAVNDGADEIDMVMNIGFLKSGNAARVLGDIAAVTSEAHAGGAKVKVIIETCLLTDDEKVLACLLSQEAGADFVKTSTGFGPGGTTPEDVALMKKAVGNALGIKASGGIHTLNSALIMIDAGADRLGVSAGVSIIREYNAKNRNG